jgi:hypothetical protein
VSWNAEEVPTKYFNRINKARRQLARANVQVDKRAMMAKALKSFIDAGNFELQFANGRPGQLQCKHTPT